MAHKVEGIEIEQLTDNDEDSEESSDGGVLNCSAADELGAEDEDNEGDECTQVVLLPV
jgi:hypothetical protein